MNLKITTWNIEHCHRLIGPNLNSIEQERIRRINETMNDIDPDILCLVEGPKGEMQMTEFCVNILGEKWIPAFLPGPADGTLDSKYQLKGMQ